jgi:uncharacterized RDD family membrane protein YckC
MADWQPYSTIAAGVAGAPVATGADTPADDTAVCVVSGKRYPKREMIQYEGKWISAPHRDEYFQRLREGVALPGQGIVPGPYGYGGFWRRFWARLLDGFIVGVVNIMILGIFGVSMFSGMQQPRPGQHADLTPFIMLQVIMQIVGLVIGISYEVFFLRKFDATPGKMALGLKLLRRDGSKLGIGRIIGRYFSHVISAIILCIGYIMAAFDEEKRALHDRICDTRVIRTR